MEAPICQDKDPVLRETIHTSMQVQETLDIVERRFGLGGRKLPLTRHNANVALPVAVARPPSPVASCRTNGEPSGRTRTTGIHSIKSDGCGGGGEKESDDINPPTEAVVERRAFGRPTERSCPHDISEVGVSLSVGGIKKGKTMSLSSSSPTRSWHSLRFVTGCSILLALVAAVAARPNSEFPFSNYPNSRPR